MSTAGGAPHLPGREGCVHRDRVSPGVTESEIRRELAPFLGVPTQMKSTNA